jgi:hypothetical protein
MKTVLEELIEKWETEIGSYIPNAPIYKAFIEDAKMLLVKEKQQIIDAYNEARLNLFRSSEKGLWKGEDYYNETFKQN